MNAAPRETVVLIHGLWMTGMESVLLRLRLRDEYGFDVQQFSYRTVNDGLADNVSALHAFLRDLPDEPLHLVGHSLGGLIALHTLQRHPEPIAVVTALIDKVEVDRFQRVASGELVRLD